MSPTDDPQETTPETPNSPLPVPVPDQNLTISANRLAGSGRCLNCGTVLQGPFCHYCGQPDKNLMRFFPVLLRELLEDFMDFDSRFMRTLKPLLFKPGKLTRDYLDGRRFRYVPPLRLYIFSSLAFFFIAALLASDSVDLKAGFDDGSESGVRLELTDEERAEYDAAMEQLSQTHPTIAAQVARSVDKAQSGTSNADASSDAPSDAPPDASAEKAAGAEFPEKPDFEVGGKPWDRETNPVKLEFMPGWFNDWINDEIADSPRKGREIAENPDLFTDKMFDVLPATMFVLLPLVALLLKFWYLFSKKYYVEHLILALHNHAFIFTLAVVLLLTDAFAAWRDPGGDGALTAVVDIFRVVALIWIPLYLLISLKRVYRQGWFLTLLKFSVIGVSYVFLLSFATLVVAGLSFVLL